MFKGASGFHAVAEATPPVGSGGIYGGDGSVPNGTTATIGDTLTFAGGNVVMGASANLLIGLNELQFVGDKIFNDSGILVIEGNTNGVVLVSDTGEELELSNGTGVTLTGSGSSFWLNTTTADGIFQFTQANGTVFNGNLGVIGGLTGDRTWRLPDASGTLALVGGAGIDGIYGGSGNVPTSVTATITDTLTFASGNVVMGTSANLLIGGNFLKFNTFDVYDDAGILTFEDTAGGQEFSFSADGGNFEYQMTNGAFICSGDGEINIDISTSDSLISYINANGSAFRGDLGSIVLTAGRTWRLPDDDGTIALVGGGGIYDGNGTIPSSVVATVTDEFTFSGGVVAFLSTLSMGAGDEIQFSAGGVITLIDTLEIKIGRVGIGGPPDASAILQADSTTEGFLQPRMTGAQVEAIGTPVTGLLAYATDAGAGDVTGAGWWGYDGTNWVQGFGGAGGGGIYDVATSGSGTVPFGALATISGTLEFSGGRIGIGNPPADSAILGLTSTTLGFLPPVMTNAQMLAITAPATGLMVYDESNQQWMGYNNSDWVILG